MASLYRGASRWRFTCPGTTPIFYLPGISREKLRAAEDCPQELSALVELQYRGVMWLHERQGMDAQRLPGFETRWPRTRCGERPSHARRTRRRPSLADGRTAFPITRPAFGFRVLQRFGGAGCYRFTALMAERSGRVQTAPLRPGMESLLPAMQKGLSV